MTKIILVLAAVATVSFTMSPAYAGKTMLLAQATKKCGPAAWAACQNQCRSNGGKNWYCDDACRNNGYSPTC